MGVATPDRVTTSQPMNMTNGRSAWSITCLHSKAIVHGLDIVGQVNQLYQQHPGGLLPSRLPRRPTKPHHVKPSRPLYPPWLCRCMLPLSGRPPNEGKGFDGAGGFDGMP